MKRLTISMSDELFEKLDRIENKSLFIRKLLERELEMLEDIPDTESKPWVQEISLLKNNVDELFSKLSEIEKHLTQRVAAGSKPESAAELLASGSLISYKDRPLVSNSDAEAKPIIIPLTELNKGISGSYVTGQEKLQDEVNLRGSYEALPERTGFEVLGREEGNPLQHEEIIPSYETPATSTVPLEMPGPERITGAAEEEDITIQCHRLQQMPEGDLSPAVSRPVLQAEHLPEKHAPISANENVPVMPQLKPQINAENETTFIAHGIDQQAVPPSKHAAIIPALNRHVVPVSEHHTVMPSPERHLIPVNEERPAAIEFTQQAGPAEPLAVMPEFRYEALKIPETAITMPELRTPFENSRPVPTGPGMETQFNGPVSGSFEQIKPIMPLFNIPDHAAGHADIKQPLFRLHEIPETPKTEKMPPFIAPSMPEIQEMQEMPPLMDKQPATASPLQQQARKPAIDRSMSQAPGRGSKPGKLESNILMYMPRGAKVKKGIIKSLVSKQFSDSEIESMIGELVSAGVLILDPANGEQYLARP